MLRSLTVAAIALTTAQASAQETAEPAPSAAAEPPPRQHRLRWTYPRFRTWQYVALGVQTAANLYIELGPTPSPNENDWRKPLPAEAGARNALLPKSIEGRARAAKVSDFLWYGTQYYPIVIDSWLVPLVFDDFNTDVAGQMTLIGWQVQGMAGVVTRLAHMTVGRARPVTHGCSNEPGAAFPCTPSGTSFFSGHAAMSASGAALACAHHTALPLYGSGPAGALTCAALSASAMTVGILRIAADKHWLSDVLVGQAVGVSIGLGLPWLLHYQHRITPKLSAIGAQQVVWLPSASRDSVSINLFGLL